MRTGSILYIIILECPYTLQIPWITRTIDRFAGGVYSHPHFCGPTLLGYIAFHRPFRRWRLPTPTFVGPLCLGISRSIDRSAGGVYPPPLLWAHFAWVYRVPRFSALFAHSLAHEEKFRPRCNGSRATPRFKFVPIAAQPPAVPCGTLIPFLGLLYL